METQYDMGCVIPLAILAVVVAICITAESLFSSPQSWHWKHHNQGISRTKCDDACKFNSGQKK